MLCCAKSLQSCLPLWDPMDCRPPVSSVPGTFQAIILVWVAMPSSRGSPQPWDWIWVSCLLHWQAGSSPLVPPGKPKGHSVHHVVSLLFVKYTKKRKWSQEKARKKKKKKTLSWGSRLESVRTKSGSRRWWRNGGFYWWHVMSSRGNSRRGIEE